MNTYPLETDEYAPVDVSVYKTTPLFTDVEFCVTLLGNRPTGVIVVNAGGNTTLGSWFPAIQEGTTFGFRVAGYDIGIYMLWARVFNNVDTPVLEINQFQII